MPKFRYSAIGADGGTVSGVEEALTLSGARRALVARDLAPVEVKEKRSVLQLEVTKKRVIPEGAPLVKTASARRADSFSRSEASR